METIFDPRTFKPSDWCGVHPSGGMAAVSIGTHGPKTEAPARVPLVPNTRWLVSALPTWAQRFDDCVGHGTGNLSEMVIRFYGRQERIDRIIRQFIGPAAVNAWQARGHRIWRLRKDDLREPYKGGLTLDGGLLALVSRGVLSERDLKPVGRRLDDIATQLKRSPVLAAHAVHQNWGDPRKDGGIDGRGVLPDPQACHCTVEVQVHERHTAADGWQRYVDEFNSWGEPWGWHGIGTLMEADHDRSVICDGIGLQPPEDDEAAASWAEGFLMRMCEAGLIGVAEEGACA